MNGQLRKATINATGEKIEVYPHKTRDTWIDASNCRDEYRPDQLTFLNQNHSK